MAVTIDLRKHSAEKPMVGGVQPTLSPLLRENLEVLHDSRNVLEEMLKIDLAHKWGYAAQFGERIGRIDRLLERLEADQEFEPGEAAYSDDE